MIAQATYPVIDMAETGRRIERRRREAGLTVRDLQDYFGFEYPQAIYKWQRGKSLPTVDNLLALARLLRVPMEDLLACDDREVLCAVSQFLARYGESKHTRCNGHSRRRKRLLRYRGSCWNNNRFVRL